MTSLIACRLALGKDWMPPEGTSPQVIEDLSMDRLNREFQDLNMESKALVSLIHLSNDEQQELVDEAISDFISNLRVGGRTAYVAACNGCASPMSESVVDDVLLQETFKHCSWFP